MKQNDDSSYTYKSITSNAGEPLNEFIALLAYDEGFLNEFLERISDKETLISASWGSVR